MIEQEKTGVALKDILRPIDSYLKAVDGIIAEKLKTGIPLIDKCAAHLFARGGKKIRASLIILCSGLKSEVPDDIPEIAAAAEIVHAATLVHDDIIDHSFLRRGEVTLSRKWGNKIAVLMGDYMYTKALQVAVGQERMDLFPELIAATCEMVKGELYQIQYSGIDAINKDHYFTIINLKTARFFSACARIAGVKAKLPDDECEILSQFGLNLGYAFQIIDDTLDIVDDRETIGKEGGNDFLDGKITLPFLHLLELSGEKEREMYRAHARKPDREKWETIRQQIIDSGSLEYCVDVAREYMERSMSYLDYFPASPFKNIILDLSHFLIARTY